MNKTLLYTAMLTLLNTPIFAETTSTPAAPASAPQVQSTPTPTPATAPATATSAATSPTASPSTAPTPAPEAVISPTTSAPSTTQAIPVTQTPTLINCLYHIPTETTIVDQGIITSWAGKAAAQSFNFNALTIDNQLGDLKACYTDQGWQGFNDALSKSGNINAIKNQHLTVSSQVDGDLVINVIKDNQWKVTVPLQVVYQNDKEKLTQLLTIDLLIGRKVSGDLGIMQMIATPRPAPGSQPVTAPAVSSEPTPASAATQGGQAAPVQ